MTANQIAYANYKETARSNQARELETYRSNRAKEVETERHNRAGEDETKRHNLFTENISVATLGENIRHNKATEYEGARHNRATEETERFRAEEQRRHNIQTENDASRRYNLDFLNYSLKADQFEHWVTEEFPAQQNLWNAQAQKAENDAAKAMSDWKSYFAQYLDDDGFTGGIGTLGWMLGNVLDWSADLIPG